MGTLVNIWSHQESSEILPLLYQQNMKALNMWDKHLTKHWRCLGITTWPPSPTLVPGLGSQWSLTSPPTASGWPWSLRMLGRMTVGCTPVIQTPPGHLLFQWPMSLSTCWTRQTTLQCSAKQVYSNSENVAIVMIVDLLNFLCLECLKSIFL